MVTSVCGSLKQLNRVAEKQRVDLEFRNLAYTIKNGRREPETILKFINGNFRSGEVTAILGPSGAGKSTLLNILAGYISHDVDATINTNGTPRNLKLFNKLSCFIEDEDLVQPHLTVEEAMDFAATVKLPLEVDSENKQLIIGEVLDFLGLQNCRESRSESLSGGERKRLAIALELLSNPPVIFLDEPTTGLDNYAAKHCVDLMHAVSRLGRTVICTIHQPSSSMFQMFDQVYVLAGGCCVYNGSPTQLIPFLTTVDQPCPINNTPADYIIEVVHMNPDKIPQLSAAVQNGVVNMKEHDSHGETLCLLDCKDEEFSVPFHLQLLMLLTRMFLQMSRNKLMLGLQFCNHLLLGLLSGLLFYGVGQDGSKMIANHNILVSNTVFFLYTYAMTPVLLLPFEIKLMKREYFNRWYSLKAYYVALTLSNLPILIILGTMYSSIIYVMTDQPMEIKRYGEYCLTGLMIGAASQALGLSIGAVFSITNGSLICPAILGPLLIISMYGKGYKDQIGPFMELVTSLDYIKHGVVSYCNAVFHKRPPLDCSDDNLCYYTKPEMMMHDLSIPIVPYVQSVAVLSSFIVLFMIMFYFALRFRLNRELSGKVRRLVRNTYIFSRLLFQESNLS